MHRFPVQSEDEGLIKLWLEGKGGGVLVRYECHAKQIVAGRGQQISSWGGGDSQIFCELKVMSRGNLFFEEIFCLIQNQK